MEAQYFRRPKFTDSVVLVKLVGIEKEQKAFIIFHHSFIIFHHSQTSSQKYSVKMKVHNWRLVVMRERRNFLSTVMLIFLQNNVLLFSSKRRIENKSINS